MVSSLKVLLLAAEVKYVLQQTAEEVAAAAAKVAVVVDSSPFYSEIKIMIFCILMDAETTSAEQFVVGCKQILETTLWGTKG